MEPVVGHNGGAAVSNPLGECEETESLVAKALDRAQQRVPTGNLGVGMEPCSRLGGEKGRELGPSLGRFAFPKKKKKHNGVREKEANRDGRMVLRRTKAREHGFPEKNRKKKKTKNQTTKTQKKNDHPQRPMGVDCEGCTV